MHTTTEKAAVQACSSPAVVFDDVHVAYAAHSGAAHQLVLKQLSLTIPHGQWIAVVGPNGSGKSTLGCVIARLTPISKGNVDGAPENAIGIVFQNPDSQLMGGTLYEEIRFGLERLHLTEAELDVRIHQAAAEVGLEAHLYSDVETLSGGQKQLVCTAACLALRPSVIIFDEATSMLDATSRRHMMQLARRFHGEGKTIIWITQILDELSSAERVLALQEGRVFFDGSPDDFFYGSVPRRDTMAPTEGGSVRAEAGLVRAEGAVAISEGPSETSTGLHLADSPCALLGFRAPYVVRTVRALEQRGVHVPGRPLSLEDLQKWMAQQCL